MSITLAMTLWLTQPTKPTTRANKVNVIVRIKTQNIRSEVLRGGHVVTNQRCQATIEITI